MIETHSKMKVADLDALSLNLIKSRLLDVIKANHILVVLDDVWSINYNEWEELEWLLKCAGKGSRVMITSRDSKVFSLHSSSLYHLGRLPEDQCWSLFQKIAFIERNSSGNVHGILESIGREIVQKYEGLSLALKALGGLLRGNADISKWKKNLRQSYLDGRDTKNPYHSLSFMKFMEKCTIRCMILSMIWHNQYQALISTKYKITRVTTSMKIAFMYHYIVSRQSNHYRILLTNHGSCGHF